MAHRLKAPLMHKFNRWTEEVSQCTKLLVHRAAIPQLLLLPDCSKTRKRTVSKKQTNKLPTVQFKDEPFQVVTGRELLAYWFLSGSPESHQKSIGLVFDALVLSGENRM